MTAATAPYVVPQPGRDWRAIALAMLMHGLLGAMLFFGVRWQSSTPAVIEAELWSALPQTAAPTPARVPPPARIEAPKKTPKVVEEPPPIKPDITIKNPVKTEPLKKKERPKEEIKPPPKVEPAPPKLQPKVEPPKTPPKPSQSMAELLASADTPSGGKDAQTSGPKGDSGYKNAIQAKIKSNLRFPIPADMQGNPEAVFEITQLPSGEIDSPKMIKSSGLPAYDAAIVRAIEASSPLPKPKDGSKPTPKLELRFTPRDKP